MAATLKMELAKASSPEEQKAFLRSLDTTVQCEAEHVQPEPSAKICDMCRLEGAFDKKALAEKIIACQTPTPAEVVKYFNAELKERICFLDGGMGTRIQAEKLEEADYRGERFKDFSAIDANGVPVSLKGNNDLLVFSKPDLVTRVSKGSGDEQFTSKFSRCQSGTGTEADTDSNMDPPATPRNHRLTTTDEPALTPMTPSVTGALSKAESNQFASKPSAMSTTPGVLRMRPRMSSRNAPVQQSTRSHWSRGGIVVHASERKPAKQKRPCQAWHPDSRSRTMFDIVGVPLLLLDAFIVPYLLAWDTPLPGLFVDMLHWCTRLFWTADLFVNLFTGYRNKDAKLVLRVQAAMSHYLHGWFLPDLTIVGLDWLSILQHGDREFVRRWMSVLRLVRTVTHLLRGWTLALKAKLMIPSKTFHLIMELSILILIIVWVNHVVCCGWYTIGGFESDTGTTWRSTHQYESSEGYAYWTALHWAITQMTPGSMEVVPKSSGERIYNISILMLGLLMGTSLVAMMTSMLTQYKLRVESSSHKFMLLHKFLTQQGVEPKLALAIKMHVKAASSERQRLRPQDVEYLSLLSNAMKDRLWCSWCQRHLMKHQLMSSLAMVDDLAMRLVYKEAIQLHEFGAGDLIFEVDTAGEDMHFVAHGQLKYRYKEEIMVEPAEEEDDDDDDMDSDVFLGPGSWCCEAALWTLWVHLGTLEAATSAEVLSLSAPRFTQAIASFPLANEVVGDYAAAFYRHINDPGAVKTDLHCVVDNCELLSSLSPETRFTLAEPVMENLGRQLPSFSFMGKANLDLLKQEVSVGKCDIRLIDGEVVRTTSIVALRLHRTYAKRLSRRNSKFKVHDAARFLVRVGERNRVTQEIKPSVVLPGVKRGWRESYQSCCDRVLDDELAELKRDVEVLFEEGSTSNVLLKESPTYGIRTRYLRTTFRGKLTSTTRIRSIAASTPLLVPTRQNFRTLLMPGESQRLHNEQRQIMDILQSRTAMVVLRHSKNQDVDNLYLWLNELEFDILSKEAALPLVKQWLQNLRSNRNSSMSSMDVFAQGSMCSSDPFSSTEDQHTASDEPATVEDSKPASGGGLVSAGESRLGEIVNVREVQSYNCEL